MPTHLKFIISFCAEVVVIILGGILGVWLVVRDIPAGEGGGLGDDIDVVGLVIFWSVLAMRREAAQETGGAEPSAAEAEGIWPPPPNL